MLDLPPGVLEAATQTVPPPTLRLFVHTLLHRCSDRAWHELRMSITLADVLHCTNPFFFKCPGINKDHLVAFRRRLWPRQETIAQLERYYSILADCSSLKVMEPKLRQLVEAVFAQESEWVRAAVLQHLVDNFHTVLAAAPFSIELMLTGERPSMTIPDDPRLHQLLRQLHAEAHAELRRQGKKVEVRELPQAAPVAPASQLQGGSSGSREDASPGSPQGEDSGGDEPSAAAGCIAGGKLASSIPFGAAASNAAGRAPGGRRGCTPEVPQSGLRHRRHV